MLHVAICNIFIHSVTYLIAGMRQKMLQWCNHTNQAFLREARRNLDIKEML
jgi:hypothetical protein